MARQPFLPKYKGTPTSMAAFCIDGLPKVAEFVGRIAINWSGVEMQLALLLGSMLGIENPASVAVFLSLRNHRAQRDALTAAAEKTLSGELKGLFDVIMTIHKRLDGQRNDVVHCVWGEAPKTPDGIIWESLQDHANMLINDYHACGKIPEYDRVANMTKNLFVWRYADLEFLNTQIRNFAAAIGSFNGYLRYKGEPAGDHALQSLRDEPLIQEVLKKSE